MKQRIEVRQGDQCMLEFPVLMGNTLINDASWIDEIEIYVGELRKTYRAGQLIFNDLTGLVLFPLSQEETFDFIEGMNLKSQIRVKFNADYGSVVSYDGPEVKVLGAKSKIQL